jgi:hypothetical protein
MAFWFKIFNVKYDVVLAVCDEELLGKGLKFEDIKVKVSENFYKGEIIDEAGAIKLMHFSTIGNLIGKRIVSLAEKEGFISKENILYIGEIPHAQFVKIR